MLKEILDLPSGVLMVSGDGRKLSRIYLEAWAKRKGRALMEKPIFRPEGEVYIGNPFEADFPVYLVLNPTSRRDITKEALFRWIDAMRRRGRLILLHEERYIADSITRYRIRNYLDYLVAYKRETMGAELLKVYKLENGRIVERKTYVRRPMTSGFGSER